MMFYLRPISRALGIIFLGILILLTLIGGVIFWTLQAAEMLANTNSSYGATDLTQLELSRNILRNTQRMVSNPNAWSESIKEEYNRLFTSEQSRHTINIP
ncbi:MAG: hypothetical protein Q8Q06_03080 [bacterium]|nr:hypothetical protein [bacterium]